MTEHALLPSAQELPDQVQRPIWSPDPGVPLTARVMAYIFAMLVLFTIIRSCASERPLDVPNYPHYWQVYHSPSGIEIPYPGGWQVTTFSQRPGTTMDFHNEQVVFVFGDRPRLDAVRVELIVAEGPYTIDALGSEYLLRRFVEKLQGDYPGFFQLASEPIDNLVDECHRFTSAIPGRTGEKLAGAWIMRVQNNRVIYLSSSTPAEGKEAMETIFAYMANGLTLTAR